MLNQQILSYIENFQKDIRDCKSYNQIDGVFLRYLNDYYLPNSIFFFLKDKKTPFETLPPNVHFSQEDINSLLSRKKLSSLLSEGIPIVRSSVEIKPLFESDIIVDNEVYILLPIIIDKTLSRVALLKFLNYDAQENQKLISFGNFIVNYAAIKYQEVYQHELKKGQTAFLRSTFEIKIDDLDLLFVKTLGAVLNYTKASFSTIWMYNDLDKALVLRAFSPKKLKGDKISYKNFDTNVLTLDKSISGRVILNKTPEFLENINNENLFRNQKFANKYDLISNYSFPIILNEEVLGVLNLWFDNHREMDSASVDLIMAICSATATKLRYAQFREIDEFLFAYDDIFNKMADVTDDHIFWDEVAKLISSHMKSEACSIFWLEEDSKLHLKGTTGLEGNTDRDKVKYNVGEGLTGLSFKKNEEIVYYKEHLEKLSGKHISKYRETLKTSKTSKSIVFLPIHENNKKFGIIRCANREKSSVRKSGRFSKDDVFKLKVIGKIISSGYARVLWSREKELEREKNLNSLHHEILSPIDGILSHIEWFDYYSKKKLFKYESERNKAKLKIDDVKQSGKLIEILVTTIGRLDDVEIKLKNVSLHNLLQTSKSFLIGESKKEKVNILIEYINLPKLNVDQYQLIRVFYNLMRNAIKYADDKEPNKYLRISAKKVKELIEINFEDNGIGVIESEKNIIFEKFKRGTNAGKVFPQGTGLGLAYCKSIIIKHGGQISFNAKSLKKPTILNITIPVIKKG